MIKEKFASPKIWLDLNLCEHIYNSSNQFFKRYKIEPLPAFETRYSNKLESVLGSVNLKAALLNHNVIQVAAAYLTHFTKSQCFMNGNKRMAVNFMVIFLSINGYKLTLKPENLWKVVIALADDKITSIDDTKKLVTQLLYKNTQKLI